MNSDRIEDTRSKEVLEDLLQAPGFDVILEKILNLTALIERERYLQASAYERTASRTDYANGYKEKKLHTRVGTLNLQVPQVRGGEFYPSCFEKGERSERALKISLAEMYLQGVSTRKVKKITEELCGKEFSSMEVSRAAKLLDEEFEQFRNRPLGKYKFVYIDAHYEKGRENGSVVNLACLKAIGVNEDGYREVIGISVKHSEAEVHWRHFFESLVVRGLHGIELIISDSHTGLKAALQSVFPTVPWQRCTFHLAQNAQFYAPKRSMKEEIGESMREIIGSSSKAKAMEKAHEVIKEYAEKAPKFSTWLEENIEEGLNFYQFSKKFWKKLRTVNMVERLHAEIKRRTRVARLFPNAESCLRLVTGVLQETHESWQTVERPYMNFTEADKE